MFPGNATVKNLVPVATFTEDTNATGIDVSEYDAPVAVVLNASAGTGNMTCDVKLQSSATVDGTYADITGAAFTRVTTTASAQKIVFDPAYTSKFVRAVVDLGGTTPSFEVSVQLIGQPKYVG